MQYTHEPTFGSVLANEVSLNTIQYTYNTISGGVMDPICVFTRPKIWLMCVFDTQYNIHTIQYRAASWTPHLTENVGVCEYILYTQYNIGRRHGPHLRVHLTQNMGICLQLYVIAVKCHVHVLRCGAQFYVSVFVRV